MSTLDIIVTKEATEPCKETFKIEIPAEKTETEYKGIIKNFKKEVAIPGFRKGKAPNQLIQKRFAKEIADELKKILFQETITNIMKDESLKPVNYPEMDGVDKDIKAGEKYNFSITIELEPDFKLPEYKGLKVEEDEVIVTDQEVDKTLESFRATEKTYKTVERSAKEKDMLKLSYKGILEKNDDEDEELGVGTKYILELEENFQILDKPERIPGMIDILAGKKAGDELKDIKITFPDDYMEKTLRGKTATYSFTIHEVQESFIPEFTDDMAKKYGADNKEEFISRLKDNIKQQKQSLISEKSIKKLHDQLLEKLDFDLPPSFLQREIDRLKDEQKIAQDKKEKDSDDNDTKSDQKFLDKAEKEAKENLRSYYLLQRIAEKEKIEVKEEDLTRHFMSMAQRTGMPLPNIVEYMKESKKLNSIKTNLLLDKAMNKIYQYAEIKKAKTTETEEKK
ncbi:MAG: trigger factor [Verrucomicrobiota bacterium]|nr:trigger factor [Verrucomicrobiota bacterium]